MEDLVDNEYREVTITCEDDTVYTFNEEVGCLTHWCRTDLEGNLSGGPTLALYRTRPVMLATAYALCKLGLIADPTPSDVRVDWSVWQAGYPSVGEVLYVASGQYWWISSPVVKIEVDVYEYGDGDDDSDFED